MSTERGQLSTLPRRTLGLAFLLVVLGFLAFTIAAYRQVFTPVVWVDLKADRAGSQLVQHADVKIRGVRVGEVRSVSATADGTVFRLALDPEQVHIVPRNVTARLVPKTLFGERYVDLLMPATPAGGAVRAGDVIREDRSKATVEVNKVFDSLMPVLRAVQPQKLATTLTAMSTALEDGNGTRLGETLVRLNSYVRELNPSLPALTEDIRSLAKVADTYAEAGPEIVRGLHDLVTTSRTVLEQRRDLESLFTVLAVTSDDLGGFLESNQDNLLGLAKTARPTLDVLERYSPEFPCLFRQLDDVRQRLNEVWGGKDGDHKLHLTVEVAASRGKYRPGVDEVRYDDKRGPACYSSPGPAPQYQPGGPIRDGSTPPSEDAPAPPAWGGLLLGPLTTGAR